MLPIIDVRGLKPNDPSVFYCGRPFAGWTASPLGNPCSKVNDYCPICGQIHYGPGMKMIFSSLPCYSRWLWKKLKAGRLIDLIRSIPEDKKLGCWCKKPETCHCTIVAKAREWLISNPTYSGGKI